MTTASLTAGFQLPPRLVVGCSDAAGAVARKSQPAGAQQNNQPQASQHAGAPAPASAAVTSSPTAAATTRAPGSSSTTAATASKKGQPWSETEHLAFISGLKKLGKGNWRGISRYYVQTRTPTQVASHAQKHFMRLNGVTKRKSRFSLLEQAAASQGILTEKPSASAAQKPAPSVPLPAAPAAAVAVSAPAARPAPVLPQWAPHPASYPAAALPGLQPSAQLMPIYPGGIFPGQAITFLPAPFAMMDGRLLAPAPAVPARGMPAMTIPLSMPLASQAPLTLPIQPAVAPSAAPSAAPAQPLQLPPPIEFTLRRPVACHVGKSKTADITVAASGAKPVKAGAPWAGKSSLGSAFHLPKATAC